MTTTAEAIQDQRNQRRADSDERLAAAVEYVTTRMAEHGDPHRGAVKLNKIVWWADQESYRRSGFSITGSDYQRLPQGPVPYRLPPVRSLLAEARRVIVTQHDVGAPKPSTILEPGPAADMKTLCELLTEDDRAMLDESLTKFHGWTGKQVSDFSHRESVAWQHLDDGELIPDSAWLIDPNPNRTLLDHLGVAELLSENGLTA